MHYPIKSLHSLTLDSPGLIPNLLYRISSLKIIIGEMGDKLQEIQFKLPEDDPKAKELEEFLKKMAEETIRLTR